jgi:hypothetical protein
MAEEKKAARFNTGKVALTYTLPLLTELESRVSMFGAVKYASWNWTKGGPLSDPLDCLRRHSDKIHAGEWLDKDSGLPHAAHARWNAGQIIQWYYAGVLDWDLPRFQYIDSLRDDIALAEQKLKEAKDKYAAERAAAGLDP